MEFSRAAIKLFLIQLIGNPIEKACSHIVFAHMGFTQKLQTLGALIDDVLQSFSIYPHLLKYKKEIRPLLEKAQTQRNQVLHDLWMMQGKNVTRTSISRVGR